MLLIEAFGLILTAGVAAAVLAESDGLIKYWYNRYRSIYHATIKRRPVEMIYGDLTKIVSIEKHPDFNKEFLKHAQAQNSRMLSNVGRFPTYMTSAKACVMEFGRLKKPLTLSEMIKQLYETKPNGCLADDLDKLKIVTCKLSEKYSSVTTMVQYIMDENQSICSHLYFDTINKLLGLFGRVGVESVYFIMGAIPNDILIDEDTKPGSRLAFVNAISSAFYTYLKSVAIDAYDAMLSEEEPRIEELGEIFEIEIGSTCRNICQQCQKPVHEMIQFRNNYQFKSLYYPTNEINCCRLCCRISNFKEDIEAKLWDHALFEFVDASIIRET